jgi:hypothetical protein
MGGGGGGIGGPLVGAIAGGMHEVALGLAAMGGVFAAAYGVARIVFTRMSKHRRAQLADLTERLRRQVEDSIRRSGRLGAGRRRALKP